MRPQQLIVLESTTFPGFTSEVLLPKLQSTGLRLDEDFFLAFSPERVDPGNPKYQTKNTPKVIGGASPHSLEHAVALYGKFIEKVIPVSSTDTAEMVKLLENTFRAVNIGLVNEVAIMCGRLGLDTWEVIEAAATKPFGFMPFYPGPGLGGHCIPIDPLYLSWKLKTLKYNARFIALADEINSAMPELVVTKVADALNDRGKAVRGLARSWWSGVTYKKDIDDARESPALDIIKLLETRGAKVAYHDQHVPPAHMEHEGLKTPSVSLDDVEAVRLRGDRHQPQPRRLRVPGRSGRTWWSTPATRRRTSAATTATRSSVCRPKRPCFRDAWQRVRPAIANTYASGLHLRALHSRG